VGSAGREITLFRAASALIALHVIDDAFVGLEPGVSPGDHLASGIVPLALLGGWGWAYPRLRPGLRGASALTLGILALAGGGVSAAALSGPGRPGSVWTGLLLIPVGLALLAIGAVVLWRSRKREGRVVLRRALLTGGAILFAFEVVVPVALAIIATHTPRDAPGAFAPGRSFRSVSIETDGLSLAGWYVPTRNRSAIVVYPARSWTREQAELLARAGYGVLALDMRGYGESDGDPNAFGWGRTGDIEAALDWLETRAGVDPARLGGLGLSVGGEQMIEAAADDPRLRAVVADGAGVRSVREELVRGPAALASIPQEAVMTAALAILGNGTPPPALDDAAADISPRALFLIEAGQPAGGEDLDDEYFEAAGEPKRLWVVPGAEHTKGVDVAPREYAARIVSFFDRFLHPR
jgi:pimeloyl-ACP methyl ester carboxylesterase